MTLLIVLGIVAAVVLFVVIPVATIIKARRMARTRVSYEDPPINTSRSISRGLDRLDVHRFRPRDWRDRSC